MQDFRNLKVWEKAHALTLKVYRATQDFPNEECYGITSQTRRCSYSIPANIAEGCGRTSKRDFARFLNIAMGSGSELEYFLLLGSDLKYLNKENYLELNKATVEVKKMLSSLIKTFRNK